MPYNRLDPDHNMDLCCFGATTANKGVHIIGILEIIGVLLVEAKIVKDCVTADKLANSQITLLTVSSLILLANIVTIGLMFYGVKKNTAYLVSAHLIVHVINIISLVFALLMASMFLVVVNTPASAVTSDPTVTPLAVTVAAVEAKSSWKWAVQISVTTLCLILETWFFNVEYTIFLQLCNKKPNRTMFTKVDVITSPKAVYG